MITADGWVSWATRVPGPPGYTGYFQIPTSRKHGAVYHSAEGGAAYLLDNPGHRPGERASWQAANFKDGRFHQYYSLLDVCWTNGSLDANVRFDAVENEGVAGEPLTDAQVANLVRLTADQRDFFGWPEVARGRQLHEHREMTAYGADPTACPSGRIPWARIIAGLQQEEPSKEVEMFRIQVPSGEQFAVDAAGKRSIGQLEAQVFDMKGIPPIMVSDAQAAAFPTIGAGPIATVDLNDLVRRIIAQVHERTKPA